MRRAAVTAFLALAMIGCGGGEDAGPADTATPTTAAPSTAAESTTTTTIYVGTNALLQAIGAAKLCDAENLAPYAQAEQIYTFCAGLTIDTSADGWEITTAPEDDVIFFGDLEAALGVIGEMTGCWSELEVQTILSTRALDGRVDSRNGQASWAYHPDDGLDILCFKEG